jgi:hypothetical protein
MKATTLLREQHRRLERLIAQVGEDQEMRLPLVLQLVEELMTHLSIEDHFFLCPIADSTGIRVDAYRDSQASLRNAVLQTVFAEEDDSAFDERLTELTSAFASHARVLERDLFPLVESQLVVPLETMGDRMQTFWEASLGTDRPSAACVNAAE